MFKTTVEKGGRLLVGTETAGLKQGMDQKQRVLRTGDRRPATGSRVEHLEGDNWMGVQPSREAQEPGGKDAPLPPTVSHFP